MSEKLPYIPPPAGYSDDDKALWNAGQHMEPNPMDPSRERLRELWKQEYEGDFRSSTPPTPHFNQLTPDQLERIAILMEECGEVVQICGKILRHGAYSHHPRTGRGNLDSLENELGDVFAAANMLYQDGFLQPRRVNRWAEEKLKKVGQYLHHFTVEFKAWW